MLLALLAMPSAPCTNRCARLKVWQAFAGLQLCLWTAKLWTARLLTCTSVIWALPAMPPAIAACWEPLKRCCKAALSPCDR